MTVLVGASPVHRTLDAAHLGALLARSLDSGLRVVAVAQKPWELPPAAITQQFRKQVRGQASEAVARLQAAVPSDVSAGTDVIEANSISEGLLGAVQEMQASFLVLASSTSGLLGRITPGSVTERLLHSSPVPVAVPPRGFTAEPGDRVTRVTVAHAPGVADPGLVHDAGQLARRVGARLRLSSFAARPAAPGASGVGLHAESEVLDVWASGAAADHEQLRSQIAAQTDPPEQDDPVVGRGTSWSAALSDVSWHRGDILITGSSRHNLSTRVFLGGTASKIVRHAPVPVVAVPHRAELSDTDHATA